MDPLRNPFNFGAGAPPEVLAGRGAEIEQVEILLGRLARGRGARSLIVYGLRGVGKTVFLLKASSLGLAAGWSVAEPIEIKSDTDFRQRLGDQAYRALLQLDRRRALGDGLKALVRVVTGFRGKVNDEGHWEIGFDPSAIAASGDLEHDLAELFEALGEVAKEHQTGFLFLVDEMQLLSLDELEAICAAMHKMSQKQLPIALVGAGLPQVLGQLAKAKSYSERLFSYPRFDRLEPEAAAKAVVEPLASEDVTITLEALERLLDLADGYPAFLQAYGEEVWRQAIDSPIVLDDVERAVPIVERMLDEQFFQVRVEKTTKAERRYLAAMASLGDGPYLVGAVARQLGREQRGVSPLRDGLIKKGVIYSPATGQVDFTVPHCARFIRRVYPFSPPSPAKAEARGTTQRSRKKAR